MERFVEQCCWGAVLKGWVKMVAQSVEFLRVNGAALVGEGCWFAH